MRLQSCVMSTGSDRLGLSWLMQVLWLLKCIVGYIPSHMPYKVLKYWPNSRYFVTQSYILLQCIGTTYHVTFLRGVEILTKLPTKHRHDIPYRMYVHMLHPSTMQSGLHMYHAPSLTRCWNTDQTHDIASHHETTSPYFVNLNNTYTGLYPDLCVLRILIFFPLPNPIIRNSTIHKICAKILSA